MAIYRVGDIAHLTVAWTDLSGNPTDTTTTLLVQAPDDTQATYTSLSGVTHDGNPNSGLYHFDLAITQAGPDAIQPAYLYRWTATGTIDDVEEGTLIVAPTILVAQPPADPPEFTFETLLAVDANITGPIRVRFQDRTIEYRSLMEALITRSLIYQKLNPNLNRQVRVYTDKGV